ncbi:hypothetical protein [Streptomyces sp. NPDC002520]
MPADSPSGRAVDHGAVWEGAARDGTYGRVERERRFLLAGPPAAAVVTARRRITDRYLTGTRLRLRCDESLDSGTRVFKLTQKTPAERPGAVQGLVTSITLSPREYELLASLPASALSKTRLSVPPMGVDVFEPPLHGLVMAEAEFATDEAAAAFVPPETAVAEVTDDIRFAGGSLVRARRCELVSRLGEYGIDLPLSG